MASVAPGLGPEAIVIRPRLGTGVAVQVRQRMGLPEAA